MPTIRPTYYKSGKAGRIWEGCVKCGKPTYMIVLPFDAGTVAPVAAEVLTGVTSGDTGVYSSVTLESGSWAGGDAAGRLYLTSPTGVNDDNAWGQDNEAVTGSTAAALVANGAGWRILTGRMHPLENLVFKDGQYYCRAHYDMIFDGDGMDRAGEAFDKSEGNRGELPH